ncbi:MAG: PAS domain S-box protein, partial [Rhodoferax sp.]|nr:PAS domain S-box protein [Rhodoferax sp.]
MKLRYAPWQSLIVRARVFALAIFVLSIWALSFYISRSLQADMQRLLGEQQFSVVTAVAQEVNDNLTDRLQALETVAKEMDAALMSNPAAVQARLEQRPLLQLLFNAGSFVTGLEGTAIADVSHSANRIGVNYMERDFIVATLKEGKSAIGRPVMGKQLNAPVLVMSVPVRDARGKVIGALAGVTNLGQPSFLDKITQNIYGKTGGYVLIAAQYRQVVTATDKSRVMELLPAPGLNIWVDRFINGYEGSTVATNPKGVDVLVSGKGIAAAGWYVLATLPTDEAFLPLYQLRQRLIWATLLLTLLTGALTWWVLRHQLAPLAATANAIVALAESTQTAQPLAITSQGEIGQLVAGFNRIVQSWTQREAALLDSQQNLTITLNAISDAVIATDTVGRITRMNPAAERLTAWPQADALGLPLTEVFRIVNAQTRLPSVNPVQRVMTQGEVMGLANHTTLLARDGREFQIADSAAPIRNASLAIVGTVLVFSDVTEKYRSELALKASEQRYRTLLENLSAGVVVHRADTTILLSNARADFLLGLTQHQMLGKAAIDPQWCFIREDGTPLPLQDYPVNLILASGLPLENCVLGVCHQGRAEPTWLICNGYPVRDDQGKMLQAVVTFTDISQRKQAEQALLHSKDMLERTESMARLASFEWDVDTNVVTWSSEMFRIFGRDPALGAPNLQGQVELYTPASTQILFAAVNKAMSDGTPYTLELMALQPDGTQRPCIVKGFPERDASGRVVRVAGLVQDITERKQAEEALKEIERAKFDILEKLNEAQEFALIGSWEWNVLTNQVWWSNETYRIFGVTPQSYVPSFDTNRQFIHPEDRARYDQVFEHSLQTGKPLEVELRILVNDGAIKHTYTKAKFVYDDVGQKLRFIGAIMDITERKQAQEKLQLAASVFTHAMEGIVITAPDATILDVNDAFTRITGYSREEAVGQNPRILKSGRHDRNFYTAMWSALTEQGHWNGEVWNRRKDGEVFVELLTVSAVQDTAGNTQQYVALFSDITASKEHQSRLEHIAHFDALTNLPNRVLLADRLQQAMAQAQRRHQQVAVAFLDLDGFKAINDHYGHVTGDQVLITLAKRMQEALREGDTLARIGGDEFVAVLIDLEDTSSSVPLLNRMLAAAALPVPVGELAPQVSASLGITFYPQAQDIDADQLMRQADQAMYQAKVAGKNRYCLF